MNIQPSIYAIAAAALIFFAAPCQSQERIVESAHGSFGPHLAVGSVNGFRAGLRYFPHNAIALEAAAGYMQVTLLRENARKEYTDGMSFTFGGSWYSHPEAGISPMISLLGVYVASATLPDGFSQTRFAIVPSLGSEYYIHHNFSVFFRFGPAFQFTKELQKSSFETATQFDAGASILF
ncbi:MAG: hypothetical protein WBQ23_10905 [Bacteroidota bacterium]